MKLRKAPFIIWFSFLFLLSGCNKEEDDNSGWHSCEGCTIESWRGVFRGPADYYDAIHTNGQENLEITITMNETGTNYLTAFVQIPGVYSATLSGELTSPYAVSFAGSNASLSATLLSMDGALKLNGNSKKFHIKIDSVVVEEVVNFDALKLPD